jgi:hypothetical protein
VIDCRADGDEEEKEEGEEEEEEEGGDEEDEQGGGTAPLRGACRGKQRRKPTRAVIQKRMTAKERMIRKYFGEMESELAVTCWCYGYTTATGKLRVGGAESMIEWWAKKYRSEGLKVHLANTGEGQQELSRLSGLELAVLLDKLNGKQLSSLASGWFKRCEPSMKHFPLDGSKGCPPWWPDGVSFQQVTSLRKPAQVQAVVAAAKAICQENSHALAQQKLEKALSTSRVLCNKSVEVRAILHTVIAQAVKTRRKPVQPATGRESASDMVQYLQLSEAMRLELLVLSSHPCKYFFTNPNIASELCKASEQGNCSLRVLDVCHI